RRCLATARCAGRLDLPHIEAVEVLELAARAAPLTPAQRKLDAHLIPHAQAVELGAAIAGELEQYDLWVLGVIGKLDDELALHEPLGHLLRLEDGVELAGGFDSHALHDTIGVCHRLLTPRIRNAVP